jgi:hypothetical protein
MFPKQQASGFYGTEIGNIAGVGNRGGIDQISQRVYGPIEKGMHNRPKYGRLTTPDVYMAPYPYTPPGEPQEFFPLGGNSRTGFRFEAGLPSRGEMLLAQSSPGGQDIGNVGGMLGEVPGNMTGFASLLESLQEQNMQNSQREKDRRSLEGYGRNLGNQQVLHRLIKYLQT